jgi:hypothetical protein
MSERRFEQSMNPREHIEQELKDAGISSPSEWRKATEIEGEMEGLEAARFKKILSYLEGEKIDVDKEKLENFKNTEDDIERLELLRRMNTAEAMQALDEAAHTEGAKKYLADRLDFYQKLIQGKATRRYTTEEWNQQKGEYVEVTKEDPIDSSYVTPETVRLGLLRDMMYASMHGTPELAGVKIATKWANEDLNQDDKKIRSVVELFGYYSGIHEGSIGQWEDLGELYKKCLKKIEKQNEQSELSGDQLEHEAVLLMARELKDAYDWGGLINTSASPYNPGFNEAVAVGRLGDEKIKAQLGGMRFKIQETNLHNIERFIGKSGPNKYEGEHRRLHWQIKNFDRLVVGDESIFQQPHLQEYAYKLNDLENRRDTNEITPEELDTQKSDLDKWFEENKTNFLETENRFMQERQTNWFTHEKERLEQKFEKGKAQVEQRDLPDEERELQLANLQARFEHDIAELETQHQQKLEYFQNRNADQLLSDLKERQETVEKRYEKRKSLAQKALDLHFQINHTGGDYDSKPLAGLVDWINYAPLGTIKRSHKMMRLGMTDEKIVEYALADIIAGARGATREDLKAMHNLVQEAQGQNWEARQKLEAMMKVGNIVSLFDYEVSLQEVEELAQKNFYGMTDALREYSLDEVKGFMDQNLDLRSVVTARKVTQKHGHDLDNTAIAEIASHNIEGLDDALNTFGLTDTKNLLSREVFLPTAIAVRDNTKAHGHELSINQIATIAKGVEDVDDFVSALRSIPLEQVEKLYNAGQRYKNYEVIRSALETNNQDASFVSALAWTQKLARHYEWHQLSDALNTFSLEELEEVNNKDITISAALDLRQALGELDFENSVSDIVRWGKIAQGWNPGNTIKSAAEKFGADNLPRMVEKEVPLQNALNVKREIDRQDLRQFDTLETIMAIAKHGGNVEVAVKTLEAGFTTAEITKYPFLISPLVAQR